MFWGWGMLSASCLIGRQNDILVEESQKKTSWSAKLLSSLHYLKIGEREGKVAFGQKAVVSTYISYIAPQPPKYKNI